MKRFKQIIAINVALLTLLAAACPQVVDRMKKLSDVIQLFEPFVQTLGLVPEKLKPILSDAKDVAKLGSDLATEMSAAQTRGEKFAAANKAQLAMVAIVNRGHFQADPRVLSVVNLISAAFSSVANFYNDAPQAGDTPKLADEKALVRDLDARISELKSALRQ